MLRRHPLADAAETDSDDLELVRRIQNGDREALESLVRRHQDWIYNIGLRMVYLPEDAEDATQEILIKLLTKLSTFEGRSSFRTWLYRLVCNHVLNMKRGRADKAEWTFLKYRRELDAACAEIHRDHPFHAAPDFVKALRDLPDQPRFRSILESH
jgi:RNA polymerase sigma factor (sigma-70 family)